MNYEDRKGFKITLDYTDEFVNFWESLKEKYPEEIFKIQGVHNTNFDINRFSKDFFRKSASVASVSVDANANVKEKSIAQYIQEYPKGIQRLNSFYLLFKWVKKCHGLKAAKEAVEKVLNGEIFINDFSNFSTSYSYYEQNSIFVRVNGQTKLMTMKDLFDTYEEFKQVFPDREVILTGSVYKGIDCLENMAIQCHDSKLRTVKGDFFAPNQKVLNKHNIEVLDADGNWVGLKQILRHKKHNNLLTYQTENGDFAMVTEDHPVILANGEEIEAGKLQVGMEVKREVPELKITETVDVSEDMAYLIGFLLGDGNIGRHKFYQNSKNITNTDIAINYSLCESTFNIYQKDIKNSKIYAVLKKIYPELNLRFEDENKIAFGSRRLKVLTSKFFGLEYGNTSFRKTLPINILDWKKESIEALIAGLIDSDGTITPNCTVNLRMKAYGLITQLFDVLRTIGVTSRKCFHESDEMFGILFAPSDKMWELSYKLSQRDKKEYNPNLNTKSVKNTVQKVHIMPSSKVLPNGEDIYEYVYDITTDSGTFYANGMTQHNCYAFDLRMLLMEGMSFFKGGMKINAPKRSDSFVALLIQTTAFISNQIMGACSYPDCFVAWDWFLRNEHGNDYMEKIRNPQTEQDKEIKKKILDQFQNLIYSFNFPFRASQCVDTDTEVATPSGFKKYNELKVGDEIYTWKDGELNIQKVQAVNVKEYNGYMHSYSGRDISQLVTPNHRIIHQINNWKKFNHGQWDIKLSEELIDRKSPLTIPVAFEENKTPDYPISDDDLMFLTCVLTDGSIDIGGMGKDGYFRQPNISIIKSEKRSSNFDLRALFDRLNLTYTVYEGSSHFEGTGNEYYGEYKRFVYNFSVESSKKYVELLNGTKRVLPAFFSKLSQRQADIVLRVWSKMDGYVIKESGHYKLQCDNEVIQDQVQQLCILACVGSKKTARWIGDNKNPTLYVMTYSRKVKDFNLKEQVPYKGLVWCPTTEDGIVVFRKNGAVFISGNSAFTNLSVMDKGYMKSLFGEYWLPDGTLPNLDSAQDLSKLFFEYFDSINGKEGMFTFPVMTLSLSLDPNGNYIDPDFKKWISKTNCTKSFSNVFIGEPDIYSSCCRLSNNIKKAGGLGFQNSFGVGGLSLGSHRVAGLNLARISQLEKENPHVLEEDVELLHKILYSHRQLLKDKISKGVMPLYTSEWISLNRQYSTIGITACNQYVANKGLDIKTEEGIECIHTVLKLIEGKIEEWQEKEKEEHCIYNLENIPAESICVRLANADKVLGYNTKYKIYSNQYIDLMENCSVYDRVRIQGSLDSLTSGGNVLHINIDGEKPLTPEQYEKIIDLAKQCKVKYFGINYAYSECEDRHYTIGKNKVCPICGKPIVETWCRVVGFITPKSAFNPVRRDYEFDRRVFYSSDEAEKAANENC